MGIEILSFKGHEVAVSIQLISPASGNTTKPDEFFGPVSIKVSIQLISPASGNFNPDVAIGALNTFPFN